MTESAPPRVESLTVRNYRALRNVTLDRLTPLTALLGPNGSGKSTVFDVFAFLSECLSDGIRRAWDRRGRFLELRSRDSTGPIVIELKYRERSEGPKSPLITYHLEINERQGRPVVSHEFLRWTRGGGSGRPFNFLDYRLGIGEVVTGDTPEKDDGRIPRPLSGPDVLAVSTLGTLAENPRVIALRAFIADWHLSYLSADATRGSPEAGAEERLSPTGGNLPNVIQYLREQHPQRLDQILGVLSERVPHLERVEAEIMADGRLLLQLKDAPFSRPIQAKYISDGTLKLLEYLTVLYDPEPPQLVGIEEPENHLHPRLLPELAEECRATTQSTQIMVTTHSPFFANGLRPEELWVLYRDSNGYTNAKRTSEMKGVGEFSQHGALLGHLWMEGHFEVGDPLTASGGAA